MSVPKRFHCRRQSGVGRFRCSPIPEGFRKLAGGQTVSGLPPEQRPHTSNLRAREGRWKMGCLLSNDSASAPIANLRHSGTSSGVHSFRGHRDRGRRSQARLPPANFPNPSGIRTPPYSISTGTETAARTPRAKTNCYPGEEIVAPKGVLPNGT